MTRSTTDTNFPTSDHGRTLIWALLLSGAFLCAVLSIVGAIVYALHGLDPAPFFVVSGTVIAGVLGLFARSPLD